MNRFRYTAFAVFLVTAIIGARVHVYAWGGFDEWMAHYESNCDSTNYEEAGNDFRYLVDCDPENSVCLTELSSFCEGFYSVCEDYCIQTWPGPWQGVEYESCDLPTSTSGHAYCECNPIE